jgi:hypothetical protein
MPVRLYDRLNDGIIKGVIHDKAAQCMVCGETCRAVAFYTGDLILPEGIEIADTSLKRLYRQGYSAIGLGISCGCYARFHRHLVHLRGER